MQNTVDNLVEPEFKQDIAPSELNPINHNEDAEMKNDNIKSLGNVHLKKQNHMYHHHIYIISVFF